MKRIIIAISLVMLIFTLSANAEEIIPMYAEDGRTTYVFESEVAAYKAEGWYEAVTVYTFDGRTERISPFALNDWLAVGWYTEPVALMWAADGRTLVIGVSSVEDFKKVGWYENKADVMETVYAPDGRTQEVFKAFVDREKSVGWMDRDEFEEYLQPWVEAYMDVTWHRSFGADYSGEYVLVKDNYSQKIVYCTNLTEYRNSQSIIDKKFPSTRYTIFSGPIISTAKAVRKTNYKSISQVYDFLGKYFSENLYPHYGNYEFFEYNNSLYSATMCEYGGLFGEGIYLGFKDNHHYVAFNIAHWDLGGIGTNIIELTNINNKLLITGYTNGSKNYELLDWYYTNADIEYTKMSTSESFMFALYLSGVNGESCNIFDVSTCTTTRHGDNQYRLYVKVNAGYAGADYHDIRFSVQNGKPVITSFNTRYYP